MADIDINDLNTEMDPDKKKKKKKKVNFPFKKFAIIFLIIVFLTGGALAGYYFFFADKPGQVEKSALPEEILIFTFNVMPLVHSGIISVSDEIVITEKEIIRINEIEKNFPDQEKITNSEKKIWDKNLLILTKFLEKHEKEIQNLYVSYRVNHETGQKLIDEQKDALVEASTEIITPSKVLTDKIRIIEDAKTFFDKVKDFLAINLE